MSNFIDIDGADYIVHVHSNGETFYIGEEVVLDDTKREIGYVCVRGEVAVVAATDYDGNVIEDRAVNGETLETEDDVIDIIRSLHDGE